MMKSFVILLVAPCWASVAFGQQTFTPKVKYGVKVGAGGIVLPMLNSPHTYNCVGGDDSAGFQMAVNQDGDVLITGAHCDLPETVSVPSDKRLQCASSSTVLYSPTIIASGPSMFLFNGLSNSGISNCTLKGANIGSLTSASYYPGAIGLPPNQMHLPPSTPMVVIYGPAKNLWFEDNVFSENVGQGAIEAVGATLSPVVFGYSLGPKLSNISGIHIVWNNFSFCSSYGPTYDNVMNSEISHNYLFNCGLGNENDNGSYTLDGVTVNYNYLERNLYGATAFGAFNNTNPFAFAFFCGMNDANDKVHSSLPNHNLGCSATGNMINGGGYLVAFENVTGQGASGSLQNPTGTYIAPNYCWNGCRCGFAGNGQPYDVAGCTPTAPPSIP
jgi:hypothetical protein